MKNDFLDTLVRSVREIINDDKMINKCDACQGLICRYLDSLNIINYPCNTQKQISSTCTGHSFTIANIDDKLYLIDPAYIQFKYDDTKDLYIKNIRCLSYSPYYYANKLNKEECSNLINNGYMPLTIDNAYWYGNSFYKTTTNIPSDFILSDIPGKTLIDSFILGNEKLHDYGYTSVEEHNKRK